MQTSKYTVINERLIRECIDIAPTVGDDDKRSREKEAPKAVLMLYEVEGLRFSFKNIAKIDNLVGFNQLTKLCLDNNEITKIENLGHLVNLTWLDLSFNQITKIEGLENLTKLEDLSVSANQISELSGMEALTELQSFYCSKNNLPDIEPVARYLRRFRKLRLLKLAENPCSTHPTYAKQLLAHIRNIKYLDSRTVEKEAVEKAREEEQEKLLMLESEEAKQDQHENERKDKEALEAKMASANMAGMNALFDDIFKDDPEAKNMNSFMELEPALKDAVDKFRTQFGEVQEEFKVKMFEHRKKKDTERQEFQSAIDEAKLDVDTRCKKLMATFEKQRKRIMAEATRKGEDEDIDEEELNVLRVELETLKTDLLEEENTQMEGYEDLIKNFVQAYTELTDLTLESITQFFTKFRDEEKAYFDGIFDIFNKMVEARHSQQQTEVGGAAESFVDSDNKQVLGMLDNKEDVMKMVNESHEAHEQKIYAKEEQLQVHEKRELEELSESLTQEERQRNRDRVSEINMHCVIVEQEINQISELGE